MVVNNEEEGIKWILKNKGRFTEGSIIYPTSDKVEKLLDINYKELKPKFLFPNANEPGRVSFFMTKSNQFELARRIGLNVLESQYYTGTELPYTFIEYPCIIKPLDSTLGSKGDMALCHNDDELQFAINHAAHTKSFIIQQYISKESEVLFLGIAFENREIEIPAAVIKPDISEYGEYSHAITTNNLHEFGNEISRIKELVREIGFKGPFSAEFAITKGQPFFLEINLRNDGISHYPLSGGINIARSYLTQEPFTSHELFSYEMIDETCDIKRWIRGELKLSDWLKAMTNAGAFKWYGERDYSLIPPLSMIFISRAIKALNKKR